MFWVVLVTVGAGAAEGQPQPCIDHIVWSGDPATVSRARDLLAHGRAAELDGSACEGIALEITQSRARWQFRLSKGDQAVEHSVADPSLMVSWIESWIEPAPVPAPDPLTPPPAAQRRAPQTDYSHPPVAVRREQSSTEAPIQLALRGVGDLDDRAATWAGAELALRVGLSQALWLGVAGAGAWTPEIDGTTRRVMRLSARLGWLERLEWAVLSVGGGIGIASANARHERAQLGPLTDHSSAPFAEAILGLEGSLGGGFGISTAMLVRAHIPDDVLDGENETGQPWVPEPLPVFALSVQVGLSWDLVPRPGRSDRTERTRRSQERSDENPAPREQGEPTRGMPTHSRGGSEAVRGAQEGRRRPDEHPAARGDARGARMHHYAPGAARVEGRSP